MLEVRGDGPGTMTVSPYLHVYTPDAKGYSGEGSSDLV